MQVNGIAGSYLKTRIALIAWGAGGFTFTVYGFSHDPGKCGLAYTAYTAEQQSMCHAIMFKGVLQSADNSLLPDNIGKNLWTPFSGKYEIGHSLKGSAKLSVSYMVGENIPYHLQQSVALKK